MKIMFIINDLGVNEPFGPMMLSAIVKQKGHQTTLGVLQQENVEAKIDSWKPDMIAYSMMSVDMADMKKFNDNLRMRKKVFTLLGGPHATLDRSCIDDPNIDAICVGEGDKAILEVVNNLEKGKSLEGIPNIMVSSDSKLELMDFIEDLDALPFMDRDLVYQYPEMAKFGIKGIWASRGCPYPCPYCFNNRFNALYKGKGKIVRRRSVDSIIRETKELVKNYRVAFVRMQDDVFVHKVDDWLKEFAKRWAEEIKIPFYCLLRSETISDEMAYYLKKAGCFSICMSIEAGDDMLRNRMLRRRISKEKLEEAFKIFKKHKINVYANTMLALPFSTLDQDIASVDFAIKVQPDMPNFSIFMPYPGTDLGDYCKQAGIYYADKEDINYGMRNASPLDCFPEKEKNAQYNLCQLAIVAVKFPALRNLIINHLIYWKSNKLFFFTHYFFAITTYGRKIFYFKHTLREYVELIVRTLKHYFYDFLSKSSQDVVGKKGIAGQTIRIQNKNRYDRIIELEKCMEAMAKNTLVNNG
ncbi:MAG: radical SAM protein [Candidatus Saganbacteria bacterium]|uniref:Radical SAM protein n=1 Tax=Candidatus Saganbacteria bacterium TaxID=2575572 RepID=A0A833L2H5_UNCSA|nr:MAG: radical SAM protein [Candidatus Saganbacteria bacterium]